MYTGRKPNPMPTTTAKAVPAIRINGIGVVGAHGLKRAPESVAHVDGGDHHGHDVDHHIAGIGKASETILKMVVFVLSTK
jgi:hypothetical protein